MTSTMTWVRVALVALGVAAAGYGLQHMLDGQEWPGIRATAIWTAVAVVVHDAILAPLLLGFGWLARKVLVNYGASEVVRRVVAAVAVTAIIAGPVTIIAYGVVGRMREGSVPPTLLERDYSLGWIAVACFAALAAVALVWSGLVSTPSNPESPSERDRSQREAD